MKAEIDIKRLAEARKALMSLRVKPKQLKDADLVRAFLDDILSPQCYHWYYEA